MTSPSPGISVNSETEWVRPRMRDYLLGRMLDHRTEEERFERVVQANPLLGTELNAVEQALMTDYLQRKLTGRDHKDFRSWYDSFVEEMRRATRFNKFKKANRHLIVPAPSGRITGLIQRGRQKLHRWHL